MRKTQTIPTTDSEFYWSVKSLEDDRDFIVSVRQVKEWYVFKTAAGVSYYVLNKLVLELALDGMKLFNINSGPSRVYMYYKNSNTLAFSRAECERRSEKSFYIREWYHGDS